MVFAKLPTGEKCLPIPLIDDALQREAQRESRFAAFSSLTEREYEVARLVSAGLSNKQIAQHLLICEGTVKLHLHNVYVKVAVANRTALAALARSHCDVSQSTFTEISYTKLLTLPFERLINLKPPALPGDTYSLGDVSRVRRTKTPKPLGPPLTRLIESIRLDWLLLRATGIDVLDCASGKGDHESPVSINFNGAT